MANVAKFHAMIWKVRAEMKIKRKLFWQFFASASPSENYEQAMIHQLMQSGRSKSKSVLSYSSPVIAAVGMSLLIHQPLQAEEVTIYDSGAPYPIVYTDTTSMIQQASMPAEEFGTGIQLASGEAVQKSEVQRQLDLLYQQNGAQAPSMNRAGGGSPSLQRRVHPGQQGQVQPTVQRAVPMEDDRSGNAVTGFFDKLKRGFRKPAPRSAPPSDPGMDYPTFQKNPAGRQQANPQPAQTAQQAVPPSPALPPAVIPPIPVTSQPGLLQTPTESHPLQNSTGGSAIPPALELSQQPDELGSNALIPEAPAGRVTLPSTVSSPNSQPVVQPTPAAVRMGDHDPFNDLFPEDLGSQEPVATENEGPYSGLSLEDNLFIEAETRQSVRSEFRMTTVSSTPADAAPADSAPTDNEPFDSAPMGEMLPPIPQEPVPPPAFEAPSNKISEIVTSNQLEGLKGFCPVALRDERELVSASSDYHVVFNGTRYELSSEEAMEKFLDDPNKYVPAAQGCDVVHLAKTGEAKEGTLDHGVWYKGRLYLFTTAETMNTFVASPASHATIR